MNRVFKWAVAAVSVVILTVVLASDAKADSLELELAPTVQLSNINGKYQASSVITPKGGCQYGYQLSLKLHELKLNNTKHQINLATEQNQSDNVWGYLEGDKLKSEGEISSENNQPVSVMYEARPKADLPAGNYRGEVHIQLLLSLRLSQWRKIYIIVGNIVMAMMYRLALGVRIYLVLNQLNYLISRVNLLLVVLKKIAWVIVVTAPA